MLGIRTQRMTHRHGAELRSFLGRTARIPRSRCDIDRVRTDAGMKLLCNKGRV